MGYQRRVHGESQSVGNMIKTLLFTCLVAAAKADVDADAAYLTYGYGLPYAYAGVPFGSSSGLDPITQGLDPVTQGAALPAFTGYYGHYLGKRSADADADAAYLAYGYGLPYAYAGVPFGSSTGLDPITQGLDPVTQGALPAYFGHTGYYGHYLGKRSADADADAFYAAYPYTAPVAYAGVPFGSSTGLDQSPRDLMLPPRDMPPSMDTLDTTDITLARGLLMPRLMLMLSMLPTLMPPQSPMPMPEFPLDPALVLTPSLRVLT